MPAAAPDAVQQFQERTRHKLAQVRCPDHRQAPRVEFRGATLRDVSIRMSGCCNKLLRLANRAIAEK